MAERSPSLDDGQARSVGAIAARAATTDIVDACVVEEAVRREDLVVTSDPDDGQLIASAVGHGRSRSTTADLLSATRA